MHGFPDVQPQEVGAVHLQDGPQVQGFPEVQPHDSLEFVAAVEHLHPSPQIHG